MIQINAMYVEITGYGKLELPASSQKPSEWRRGRARELRPCGRRVGPCDAHIRRRVVSVAEQRGDAQCSAVYGLSIYTLRPASVRRQKSPHADDFVATQL